MKIETKKRKDRSESLFVFNFESEDDYQGMIMFLESWAESEGASADAENVYVRNVVKELVDKIKERCDAKYARKGVVCSSCLFADEMSKLVICLLYNGMHKDITLESIEHTLRELKKSVDREQKLLKGLLEGA